MNWGPNLQLTRTIRRGGRMRPRAPAPPRPEIMAASALRENPRGEVEKTKCQEKAGQLSWKPSRGTKAPPKTLVARMVGVAELLSRQQVNRASACVFAGVGKMVKPGGRIQLKVNETALLVASAFSP